MAELKQITDENYEKDVMQSEDIWCVTFSALSFCQPCKMLHPIIENIAKNDKVPGVKFGTVATEDTGLNFSTSLSIRNVPTTHIMSKGKILGTLPGFVPEKDFIEFVKKTAKV
ncbi:MAG: thioredoxin family protein [Pelagibacteraceae bacterium]